MWRVHTAASMVALVCMLSVLAFAVEAQELPGRIACADSDAAHAFQAVGASVSPTDAYDLIFGTNTRGPYALFWKPINQFSERVLVDKRLMLRALDYDIDYASGLIAFAEPISSRSIVRVDYSYDPAAAVQNRKALRIPLTLDLVKKENAGVQFLGLYGQADLGAQSGSDFAVYGLASATSSKAGGLSSMLLYSPEMAGRQGWDKGSFGDRSALQLGGSAKNDAFQLSASYLHVGEEFIGAQDYKLQRGLDSLDFAAALNLSSASSLSSSVKRSAVSFGEKKGEVDSATTHSLVFAPENGPKLTVSRTETEKEQPGIADRTVTTNKVQLEREAGSNLSAVASREAVTTITGGSESRSNTDQIAVDFQPARDVSLRSKFTEKDSAGGGRESNFGLGVDAALSSSLTVSAAMSRLDSDLAGKTDTESISLAANPSQLLNLQMSIARTDAAATGDELVHSVKLVSALRPDTRLEFGMAGRNVERPEDEATHMVKLSTTALKSMEIQVDWTGGESEVRGPEEFCGIRVETSPIQSVKLSGAFGQKETPAAREINREARVEVSPFEHTKLGGGVKEMKSNGAVVSRVTDVSASTKPVGFLELSGAYRLRKFLEEDDLDSLNLALALDAGSLMRLTGAYTSNPEDKYGAVQRLNSQSIGLRSDLGRLRLKSAFTRRDEYLAGKRSEGIELGLDYRLSSDSLLTTSYSAREYREASALATEIYALGYTHRIGSRLDLYLGGKMMRENDQAALGDETEYQAEARLGIKF